MFGIGNKEKKQDPNQVLWLSRIPLNMFVDLIQGNKILHVKAEGPTDRQDNIVV